MLYYIYKINKGEMKMRIAIMEQHENGLYCCEIKEKNLLNKWEIIAGTITSTSNEAQKFAYEHGADKLIMKSELAHYTCF
jgi:hypothetical protein